MRLAAAVLVLLTSTAVAQPGATPPVYAPPPAPPVYAPAQPMYQPAQPTQPARPRKNESTGTMLAIGATAAGLGTIYLAVDDDSEGLAWAGLALTLIGPSAGHLYAGETAHAVKMSLLRVGGFAAVMYGAVAQSSGDCIDYCSYDDDDGEAAMWIGGAVIVGATLYDFIDASRAVRRANRKHEQAWTVAPTMMSAQGQRSPGVALSGTF